MIGDLTYFRRDAVNFYGVFLKDYDIGNPYKDKLSIVRKNYYETGLQTQKRKFTDIGEDGKSYKYNYTLNEDTILKWKVINPVGKTIESVSSKRDSDDYRVEVRDNFGKLKKCIYFGSYHNWIKTKYYGTGTTEPKAELVYWDKNGIGVILKFTAEGSKDKPEVLLPLKTVDDPILLEKLTDKFGVPEVSALCTTGYVYFAADNIAKEWERYSRDPSLFEEDELDYGDIYSNTPPVKVDLTRTNEVIVPEKAKQDSIVFNFDTDPLPPSRSFNINKENERPEMPKLHSEALIDDSQKRDVFDLLYSGDDMTTEPIEDEKSEELLEDEENGSYDSNMSSNDDTPELTVTEEQDTQTEEEKEKEKEEEEKAKDEEEDTIGTALDITREFEIPLQYLGKDKSGYTGKKTIEFKKPLTEQLENNTTTSYSKQKTQVTHPEYKDGELYPSKAIRTDSGESYYYYGEMNGRGQRHGRGRTSMHDDLTAYEGEYKNDMRDGFGAYYYSNGKICYIGDWSENRRNGVGISFRPRDRSMYIGRWENNCPGGMGAKFDENGDLSFVGRFDTGAKDGIGMMYRPNDGGIIVSYWDDDKQSEKCTLFDNKGNLLYSGALKNNKRNGFGTQYDTTGQVNYHGEWKDDKFNGEGIYTLSNGCKVSGTFLMGAINGYAVFTTKRGKKIYEGDWVRNRFHGQGKKYNIKTGEWYSGTFADGKPVGELSCYDRDGNLIYKGELKNEVYHGLGIQYQDGEKIYDGEWKNGVRNGTGTEFSNDMPIYKGKFKDGVRRGIGTSYNEEGKPEYSGHWTDGTPDGEGLLYKDGKPYLAGSFINGVPQGRINEIREGTVVKECIYNDGKCVYMREFTEDGAAVKYEGYVQNGLYEGMGCAFSQYGEKYFEGIFKNGEPSKNMQVRLQRLEDLPLRTKLIGSEYSRYTKGPNYVIEREYGTGSYSGLLVGGRPYGKGTIIYTDHGYTGTFADGQASGLGVIYEWNGREVKGTFVRQENERTTKISFADGVEYYLLKDE